MSENTDKVKVSKDVQEQIDQAALKAAEAELRRKEAEAKSAELDAQIKEQELELKREQLEALKMQAFDLAQRRKAIQQKLKNAVVAEKARLAKEAREQAICNHSQGGEGLDGLFLGDGVQSTYQEETDSLGRKVYRCIRCNRTVSYEHSPEEFVEIAKKPRKGLKGPIPIIFELFENGQKVKIPGTIQRA
jgi:hypothetical protein